MSSLKRQIAARTTRRWGDPRSGIAEPTSAQPAIGDALRPFSGRFRQTPRMATIEVLGLYPVEAAQPCFLLEVLVSGSDGPFDLGEITQADGSTPSTDWQVPYAEKLLAPEGDAVLLDLWDGDGNPEMWVGDIRLAFFMHQLDLTSPLATPFGEATLPAPTARPSRLQAIEYETP